MKPARTIPRLLACLIFALLLAFPVVSTGGSSPECIKECADELVQCKKLCRQKIKDPQGQKICLEQSCKEVHKACLEDWRDE
jgi:hypothetical protein